MVDNVIDTYCSCGLRAKLHSIDARTYDADNDPPFPPEDPPNPLESQSDDLLSRQVIRCPHEILLIMATRIAAGKPDLTIMSKCESLHNC